jgi:hypothetical protein
VTESGEIERRLAAVAESLGADGYALRVQGVGSSLYLRVVAGEDACPDCLVPSGVLARIVSAALDGAFPPDRIVLTYPEETDQQGPTTALPS